MNNVQIPTTVIPVIAWVAGLLAGKGVFGFDSATWISILSGIVGLALTLYGAYITRKSALTTTVANLDEVSKIKLDPSAPGSKALEAATPSNVKVTP